MRKNVTAAAVVALILVVLALAGQFYFPLVVNMILISVLGLYALIMASVFAAGIAYVQSPPSDKVPEEKEEISSEKTDNPQTPENEIAKEDGIIASLSEKLKEKEAELIKLKKSNDELSSELEEQKEKVLSLSSNASGPACENEDCVSALLPLSDEQGSEEINIIHVCRDAIKDLQEGAKKAGLKINISTTEDSLLVKASEKRLLILFKNIIDNSIKYMNRQGSLTITISNIGSDIFIVLKDTGEGLTESETRHIFELNYQGSNRISGNGLGLAQAKAIVDYYGGTIYAKSNVNQGMAIYIQLPTT
ncbi:MAG: HAMP domain-containing histidine kinase [Lachnospiraceae bacterium]|nr:HAMP domain-containing histidine kinase [Lachnospiraceae bacterium]